jgi:hypothetical protein
MAAMLPGIWSFKPNTTRLFGRAHVHFSVRDGRRRELDGRADAPLIKLMAEIGRVVGVELAGGIDGPENSVCAPPAEMLGTVPSMAKVALLAEIGAWTKSRFECQKPSPGRAMRKNRRCC